MTVAFEEVRGTLLTLDDVRNKINSTEPLTTTLLSSDDKIAFQFEPDWALSLDALHDDVPVAATVRVNGYDRQLSKTAALQAGANFGVTAALAKKLPSNLLEQLVNYWFSGGMGEKSFNMLSLGANDVVSAFTRPTLHPFSNISLLDSTLEGIARNHEGQEVLADYKFSHTLQQTDIRLILPDYTREITDSGTSNDVWSAGVHLSNSLTGKKMTSVEAYLFRWWCSNGATTQFTDAGVWSRRNNGQNEESVMEWAASAVDEVLGGLETRFDEVQALTRLPLRGDNRADVLREIFKDYKVPVSQRSQIVENLEDEPEMTMYAVMQAITRVANGSTISAERADALMRIGGAIPSDTFETLKARIWAEGHQADDTAENPYEIAPVTA